MNRNGRSSPAGTPVPSIKIEQSVRMCSAVKEYKLSDEELERYRNMGKPKRRTQPEPTPSIANESTSEERVDMPKIQKEDYLKLRVQGLTRPQSLKYLHVSMKVLYEHLDEWEIRSAEAEQQAIAEFTSGISDLIRPPLPAPSDSYTQEPVDNDNGHNITIPMTLSLAVGDKIMQQVLNAIIEEVHDTAVSKGWYENTVPFVAQIALIHSELSEALEADRKSHGADKVAEELADVVIRTFDTAAAHGYDLSGALFRKMAKNREREYRHGGLKY